MKKILLISVVLLALVVIGIGAYYFLTSPELTDDSEIEVLISDVQRILDTDFDEVVNPTWFIEKYGDVRLTKHQQDLFDHTVEYSHKHNEMVNELSKDGSTKAVEKIDEAIEIVHQIKNDIIFVKDKK